MSNDERDLALVWRQFVGASPVAQAWFDRIVALHRDPSRHYHDLRHVVWVVRHVRSLGDEVELDEASTGALVVAACFHDAVCDPTRFDNEERSAALARRALYEFGWPDDVIDRVTAMIEATATHEPGDAVTAVLIAADLGVLATEPARYGDYVRNVRREYAHLDDAAWSAGRSAFLRQMLARAAIFPPMLPLDTWERRARANLTAELAAFPDVSDECGEGDAHEP
jgi:predicted metal-dependent HD superfamily phosphohydrolase